jgi:uncharacterized membrane protein
MYLDFASNSACRASSPPEEVTRPMPGTAEKPTPQRRDAGAFHTAMAHFYRAEIHRMTLWRTRLDTTSNWAILLTTGLTTFTLGAPGVPHYTLLLGLTLNLICLVIEGRRYQHLHHSEWRVRLMETGYLAPWLESHPAAPDWCAELAADLRAPHATIDIVTAVRMRLRRNYVFLFYFITAVWLTKLFIHQGGASVPTFYERLAVGIIPSWFVAGSATAFISAITGLAIVTAGREPVEHLGGARDDARAHCAPADLGLDQ